MNKEELQQALLERQQKIKGEKKPKTDPKRIDPSVFAGIDGYAYEAPYAIHKQIADRNNIQAAPLGVAIDKPVSIAQCPHCGFYLLYTFDEETLTKVIPLNTFYVKNRKRAGMWKEECEQYDLHKGVLCPKCRKPWRVPDAQPGKGGK